MVQTHLRSLSVCVCILCRSLSISSIVLSPPPLLSPLSVAFAGFVASTRKTCVYVPPPPSALRSYVYSKATHTHKLYKYVSLSLRST